MAENNKNQKRLNGRKEFNRLAGHEENKRLPQHEPEKRLGAYVEPEKDAAMGATPRKSSGMGLMGWAALAVLALVGAAIVAMFFTDGRMLVKNDRSSHSIARVQKARAASFAATPAAPGASAVSGKVAYFDSDVYAAEVTPDQTVAAYSNGSTEEAVGVRHKKTVIQPVIKRVVVIPAVVAANTAADSTASNANPALAAVDDYGTVYFFEFDDAGIPENATLNSVAQSARKSGKNVEINAYSDPSGSAAYNRNLSQRRADAVGRYLVNHGVKSSRIKAHGMGSTDAYATPALDRRAEISIK